MPIDFGAWQLSLEKWIRGRVPIERHRTSEVGTYRERLLQPKGAGGQHRAAHAAIAHDRKEHGQSKMHRDGIG